MENIHVIYASTSGNTELVLDFICDFLQKTENMKFDMHRAELTDIEVILNNKIFIMGTSTWEHGALNPFFGKLLKQMNKNNMTGKYAAFVGCGNSKYESVLFCKAIDIVKEAFLGQDGNQIGQTLKVDGDPHNQLELNIKKWAEDIAPQFMEVINTAQGGLPRAES